MKVGDLVKESGCHQSGFGLVVEVSIENVGKLIHVLWAEGWKCWYINSELEVFNESR